VPPDPRPASYDTPWRTARITCQDGDVTSDHVFVCGSPALDFCATLRARRTSAFETLTTPDRLDAWYREAGVADEVAPATAADVERAKEVREAVYGLVTARRKGEPHEEGALGTVNAAARRPAAAPQLRASGRWTRATQAEALSSVARAAVELLAGPDVPLLKECGNPECTRVYVDRSHGMRRQWCGMESCGNRIKAAAYRARRRSAQAPAAG
jgi:predicted RNA-binding Zn ribbon-like protein